MNPLNQLEVALLIGNIVIFAAYAREAFLRERAEQRAIHEVIKAHKDCNEFVQAERERAELLFASKSVGEYLQARKVAKLPTHIEKPRTTVPLSDEELARMEKNGAFATGGAAVEIGG